MANLTVTIADGESLSDAKRISYPDQQGGGYTTLVGIIVPSTWTTAVMSFEAGLTSDGTFYPVINASGAEVVTGSINVDGLHVDDPGLWVTLDPADFAGVPYLKVRSGTRASAVNQSGGDSLTLVTRSV